MSMLDIWLIFSLNLLRLFPPLVNFPHNLILWTDLWTEEAMRANIVYRMANRCKSDIKMWSSQINVNEKSDFSLNTVNRSQ